MPTEFQRVQCKCTLAHDKRRFLHYRTGTLSGDECVKMRLHVISPSNLVTNDHLVLETQSLYQLSSCNTELSPCSTLQKTILFLDSDRLLGCRLDNIHVCLPVFCFTNFGFLVIKTHFNAYSLRSSCKHLFLDSFYVTLLLC